LKQQKVFPTHTIVTIKVLANFFYESRIMARVVSPAQMAVRSELAALNIAETETGKDLIE
jgi:hypothetical protein